MLWRMSVMAVSIGGDADGDHEGRDHEQGHGREADARPTQQGLGRVAARPPWAHAAPSTRRE